MSLRGSSLLTVATVLILLLLLLRQSSAVISQKTCATQVETLPSNRYYANCTDFPYLNATLHFTYNAANSSLSIAYIAPPAPGGAWISWAINLISTGMEGSQAIIALKPTGGSAVVAKTFNISSYSSIVESLLSFDVWGLAADEVNGTMRLFAYVKVPASLVSIHHVWQVGGVVNGTRPRIHPLSKDYKLSMGLLELVSSTAKAPTPSSGGGTAPTPDKGDRTRVTGRHGWWFGVLGAMAFGLTF